MRVRLRLRRLELGDFRFRLRRLFLRLRERLPRRGSSLGRVRLSLGGFLSSLGGFLSSLGGFLSSLGGFLLRPLRLLLRLLRLLLRPPRALRLLPLLLEQRLQRVDPRLQPLPRRLRLPLRPLELLHQPLHGGVSRLGAHLERLALRPHRLALLLRLIRARLGLFERLRVGVAEPEEGKRALRLGRGEPLPPRALAPLLVAQRRRTRRRLLRRPGVRLEPSDALARLRRRRRRLGRVRLERRDPRRGLGERVRIGRPRVGEPVLHLGGVLRLRRGDRLRGLELALELGDSRRRRHEFRRRESLLGRGFGRGGRRRVRVRIVRGNRSFIITEGWWFRGGFRGGFERRFSCGDVGEGLRAFEGGSHARDLGVGAGEHDAVHAVLAPARLLRGSPDALVVRVLGDAPLRLRRGVVDARDARQRGLELEEEQRALLRERLLLLEVPGDDLREVGVVVEAELLRARDRERDVGAKRCVGGGGGVHGGRGGRRRRFRQRRVHGALHRLLQRSSRLARALARLLRHLARPSRDRFHVRAEHRGGGGGGRGGGRRGSRDRGRDRTGGPRARAGVEGGGRGVERAAAQKSAAPFRRRQVATSVNSSIQKLIVSEHSSRL